MADVEKQPGHPNLRRGGKIGNAGGTGRPPNAIRERARAIHEDALRILKDELKRARKEQLANKPFNIGRVLEIADHVGKFGIGTKLEVEQEPAPPTRGPMTFEEAEQLGRQALEAEKKE